MRSLLFGILSVFVLAWGASAQEVLRPQEKIEATIQNQLNAFLVDDFEQAFEYASPSIQGLFGSPQRFGEMVRGGYPMVWRNRNVQFGDLRLIAGSLWQRVFVTDAQGVEHALDYKMHKVGEDWRISGVQLLPKPDVSA